MIMNSLSTLPEIPFDMNNSQELSVKPRRRSYNSQINSSISFTSLSERDRKMLTTGLLVMIVEIPVNIINFFKNGAKKVINNIKSTIKSHAATVENVKFEPKVFKTAAEEVELNASTIELIKDYKKTAKTGQLGPFDNELLKNIFEENGIDSTFSEAFLNEVEGKSSKEYSKSVLAFFKRHGIE